MESLPHNPENNIITPPQLSEYCQGLEKLREQLGISATAPLNQLVELTDMMVLRTASRTV